MIYRKKTDRGFTLIELIVVIAIIALLSRVILVSMNAAKAKARDTWRKQQLVQLQNALALYYTKNGSYPTAPDLISIGIPNTLGFTARGTGPTGYIPGLVPDYISVLPTDPQATFEKFGFGYMTGPAPAKHYKIWLFQTPESNNPGQKFYDPSSPDGSDWLITDKYDIPPPTIPGNDPVNNNTPEGICSYVRSKFYNDPQPWVYDWPICW